MLISASLHHNSQPAVCNSTRLNTVCDGGNFEAREQGDGLLAYRRSHHFAPYLLLPLCLTSCSASVLCRNTCGKHLTTS